jgi:hypothetical protein
METGESTALDAKLDVARCVDADARTSSDDILFKHFTQKQTDTEDEDGGIFREIKSSPSCGNKIWSEWVCSASGIDETKHKVAEELDIKEEDEKWDGKVEGDKREKIDTDGTEEEEAETTAEEKHDGRQEEGLPGNDDGDEEGVLEAETSSVAALSECRGAVLATATTSVSCQEPTSEEEARSARTRAVTVPSRESPISAITSHSSSLKRRTTSIT